MPSFVRVLLYLLVVVIIGGVASFLLNRAPFLSPEYKSAGNWFILAAVVIVCLVVLLNAFGGNMIVVR